MKLDTVVFSIIIVSLNAQNTIMKTIDSVLIQEFRDFEIVVKDGCSTDNTLAYIPYSNKIKLVKQIDDGIYDAMNQAVKYASGRYLLFLNCGDVFASKKVLQNVYNLSVLNKDYVIYGDYIRNEVLFRQPRKLSKKYLYRTPLCHQTMFFPRSFFNAVGLFDIDLQICADYDLTLKAFVKGCDYRHVDIIICDYLGGGVSEILKNNERKNNEINKIRREYFSRKDLLIYSLYMSLSLFYIRKILISDSSPKIIRNIYRFIINTVNTYIKI